MTNMIVVAYWPDHSDQCGGDRQELPPLLRRYCQCATRVVIYEEREVIWNVPHVLKALTRWQKGGEQV